VLVLLVLLAALVGVGTVGTVVGAQVAVAWAGVMAIGMVEVDKAATMAVVAADEVVAVVQMAVAVQMEAVVCMVVCLGEARAAAVRVRSR
jgi:hypothetical protein